MARVGLLPLYIELYDEACPEMRPEVEAFYERIAGELRGRELEVCTRPICRRAEELSLIHIYGGVCPGNKGD